MMVFRTILKSNFYRVLSLFILIAAASEVEAKPYDNYGLGVLDVRSQSIVQSLRLTLPIVVPQSIQKGIGYHFDNTWTNVWAQTNEYLLDYEMVESSFGISYGTDRNLKFRLDFISRRYIGGAMDNLIQRGHDLEGISQNGRDKYERNRSVITIYNSLTSTWEESDAEELNNQGVNLIMSYDIDGNWFFPSVNLYSVVRYNIESANIFKEIDDFDMGIGLGFSKRLSEKVYIYTVFGYSYFNEEVNTDDNHLKFHKSQRSFFLALSWHHNPSLSFVVQYLYGDAMVKNLGGLNEDSHEIHVGTKMRLSKNLYMDFSIIENTINMDNSPDFGFHLGFSLFI